MTRGLMVALICAALLTGGCATTFAPRDAGVPDASTVVSPEQTDPRAPTNFGSATRPRFGPQYP